MTTSVSTTAQPTIKAFNAKAQKASVSDYIADDLNAACIYVGTYRKYNEGSIFGEWIDLDKVYDYEELLEVCHKLHSDEDDPEFMVQDYQNFPRDFYSECLDEDDFDKIKAYLELGDKKEAYEAYVDATGDDDIERFLARYEGEWDSEEEFAEHIVEGMWINPRTGKELRMTKMYADNEFVDVPKYLDYEDPQNIGREYAYKIWNENYKSMMGGSVEFKAAGKYKLHFKVSNCPQNIAEGESAPGAAKKETPLFVRCDEGVAHLQAQTGIQLAGNQFDFRHLPLGKVHRTTVAVLGAVESRAFQLF